MICVYKNPSFYHEILLLACLPACLAQNMCISGYYSNSSLFIYIHVTDIQEFYELTLLDDTKSVQEKTQETIRIASKWEGSDGPMPLLNAVQAQVSFFPCFLEFCKYFNILG